MLSLISPLARVALVAFVSSLGSCAITTQYGQGDETGTPVYLNQFAGPDDAFLAARAHCGQYGKVPLEKSRSAVRIDFACVQPSEAQEIKQLVPLTREGLAKLRSVGPIHAVHYEFPPLLADPPRRPGPSVAPGFADSTISTGGGLFPFLFGLALDLSVLEAQKTEAESYDQRMKESRQRGARLIEDYAIEDPIVPLTAHILSRFQNEGMSNVINVRGPISRETANEQLKAKFGGGLIFEFGTSWWEFSKAALPSVSYHAYVKLRFLEDQSEIWHAYCGQPLQPIQAGIKQGTQELGTDLRTKLRDLAERCAAGMFRSLTTPIPSREH